MIDRFQSLMTELGEVLHLPLHIDKKGACSILIPPELVIQLELDSTQENLLLFCKLIEIPPGKFRENVLLAALKSNDQCDPIPGILAYLHATNHLVLFQNYPINILDGMRVVGLFTAFLEMAESWYSAIKTGRNSPG